MPGIAVTKGRITSVRTRQFREFMFNPNDVSDTKNVNYGTVDLPGASTPAIQYGSGGERIVSFELYLDGDRGRSNLRLKSLNGASALSTIPIDISDEIRFYRSLLYPAQYDSNRGFVSLFPDLVQLTLGAYLTGFTCVVKQAPINVLFWTPKMEPVRATVPLVFSEVRDRSQTSADVLDGIGG